MIDRVRIHTEPPRLSLESTRPRMEMERAGPGLRIRSHEAQVSVDRSDYREALGLLLPVELTAKLSQQARDASRRAVQDTVAEGDALMRIEEGTSIATVAQQGAAPPDAGRLVLRPVPPPRRTITPGGLDIEGLPGELRITPSPGTVRINFQPGRVTVDTEVPPRLNVQV